MTDIKYEPTREHWTPYEPWMRDVLADDARVSWVDGDDERRATWDHYNYAMDAWLTSRDARIHPDDIPERPTEDDPDEALAKALWEIDDPEPTYGWDRARVNGAYRRMAHAAREHIEQEIPEELDKIGITWQSRARRMGKRAEEAEADVERLTRERDFQTARADDLGIRVQKAEAEAERLTYLLGSHADGHRCTCEMTDPGVYHGNNMHPPEWEQDPWCPTHPNMNYVTAEVKRLRERTEKAEAEEARLERINDEMGKALTAAREDVLRLTRERDDVLGEGKYAASRGTPLNPTEGGSDE